MEHGRAICHIWPCINYTHAFVLVDVRVRFWIFLVVLFRVRWTSVFLRWFLALVPSNPFVYVLYLSDSLTLGFNLHLELDYRADPVVCQDRVVQSRLGCIQNKFIYTHNLINPARKIIVASVVKILSVRYTRWAWRVYLRRGKDQHPLEGHCARK